MVGAGATAPAVHADPQRRRRARCRPARFAQTVRDDKGSVRVDGNTRFGLLTRLLLPRRLPARQSVSGTAGRRERAGLRRADGWPCAALVVLAAPRPSATNTVNEFHASLTHNREQRRHAERRPRRHARVARLRHRSRHARHRGAGAAARRRREPRLQHVHDGGHDHRRRIRRATPLHLADSVSRVWGAHTVKFGGQYQFAQVRLEPNATFNGTFTFAGTETGSDFADFLLGVPSNYIQSSGGVFSSAESVRRRVRAGQLARALESDDQLRRAVGHHGAVVREGQSDPDHRARPAVGRSFRTRRSAWCFPATRASRAGSRRRGSATSHRGSAWRTRRTRRRACARATGCSTPRSRGCPPASCTACRPTATTT